MNSASILALCLNPSRARAGRFDRARRFVILLAVMAGMLGGSASHAQQPGSGLTMIIKPWHASDFALPDLDGNIHRLSDYRGKVVVVNFWATWCPPCRAEMPSMQRAWEKLGDQGVVVLGIDVGEDEDTVFEFTANYPVDFPLLLDADSSVIEDWPVRGLPTSYIVDPHGRVVYRAIGGREWDSDELLHRVLELRAGDQPARP